MANTKKIDVASLIEEQKISIFALGRVVNNYQAREGAGLSPPSETEAEAVP